jgi:hypothetical protein
MPAAPEAERSSPAPAPDPAPVLADRSPTPVAEAAGPSATVRPGWVRGLAGFGVALLLIVGVGSRLLSSTSAGPVAPSPRATVSAAGTLVYVSDEGAPSGREVVWTLDLATDEARRGPVIPSAVDLFDASYAGPGWIGLDASAPDGGTRAFLLRGTSPSVVPDRLAAGDLLAWGPGGRSLAIAHRGEPDGAGCRRIWINVVTVQTGLSQRVLDDRSCGDVRSLGRGWTATYLTWVRPGRTEVEYAGVSGVRHPVLPGYDLLSVSPNSDFLGAPATGERRGRGAVLFWRGHGGPLQLGTAQGQLVITRVLCWAPDGSRALVEGQLLATRGLFQIEGGPGPTSSRREPSFLVGPVPDRLSTSATYASDGSLYLSIAGRLFRYRDGGSREIALPVGAPPPSGPIVWLP